MNKVATISLASAGGLLLFSVAYIGFAKLNGVPMHTLPVFGSLFPAPPESEASEDEAHASGTAEGEHGEKPAETNPEGHGEEVATNEHGEKPIASATESHGASHGSESPRREEAKADVLGMFQFESPYTADELRELVSTLERRNKELDRRLAELANKEELADDRLEAIEDRQKALDTMKAELEELQAELAARAEELERDGQKKSDDEQKSVRALGALFEDGEPDALASRLVGYGPKEAAKILATLQPDRAKELLDALPQAKWREFAEAYTKTVAAQKTK
jgi:flagellar motility protein MotE (MotC chaperone)